MAKERYFYSWEDEKVYDMNDMLWLYLQYGDEYDYSFEHFISNCLTRNNGTMDEITNNNIQDYLKRYDFRKNGYKVYDLYTGDELKNIPSGSLVCFSIDYAEEDENGNDIDNIIVFIH